MAAAKVVGEQGAPSGGEADAAVEVMVQLENLLHIQSIRRDEALLARVAATRLEPADVLVTGDDGVLGVDALAGPVGDPIRRAFEELRGAEGVWQKDEQLAAVALLP